MHKKLQREERQKLAKRKLLRPGDDPQNPRLKRRKHPPREECDLSRADLVQLFRKHLRKSVAQYGKFPASALGKFLHWEKQEPPRMDLLSHLSGLELGVICTSLKHDGFLQELLLSRIGLTITTVPESMRQCALAHGILHQLDQEVITYAAAHNERIKVARAKDDVSKAMDSTRWANLVETTVEHLLFLEEWLGGIPLCCPESPEDPVPNHLLLTLDPMDSDHIVDNHFRLGYIQKGDHPKLIRSWQGDGAPVLFRMVLNKDRKPHDIQIIKVKKYDLSATSLRPIHVQWHDQSEYEPLLVSSLEEDVHCIETIQGCRLLPHVLVRLIVQYLCVYDLLHRSV